MPRSTNRGIELSIRVASMTISVLLFLPYTGEATWHDLIFLDFSSVTAFSLGSTGLKVIALNGDNLQWLSGIPL